jgi:hypothetical protein
VLLFVAALPPPLLLPFYFALAGLIILALLLLFLMTALPFLRKVSARDRAVLLVAPLLLALRAFSLSLGYAWGVVRPPPGR